MQFKLSYNEPEGLDFNSISVVGDFNDWNGESHSLIRDEDGIWSISLELAPGTYKYRFLVNNKFTINDPLANIYLPNELGILMSVIIINDNLQRMINPNKYNVDFHDYLLTTDISELPCEQNTHLFFVPQDEKIVCRLDFTNVTGIHTISVLWYTPDMELFDINESILWQPDQSKPVMLWFWIDSTRNMLKNGTWKIKFLLDGLFIFEDKFVIDMTDDLIIEMIKSRDSFFGLSSFSNPDDNRVIAEDQNIDSDIVNTMVDLDPIGVQSQKNEQSGSLSSIVENIDSIIENLYDNIYVESTVESHDRSVSSDPDFGVDTAIDLLESICEITDESNDEDIKEDNSNNTLNKNQLPDI